MIAGIVLDQSPEPPSSLKVFLAGGYWDGYQRRLAENL